jgi:hypothetical protein
MFHCDWGAGKSLISEKNYSEILGRFHAANSINQSDRKYFDFSVITTEKNQQLRLKNSLSCLQNAFESFSIK